MDTANTALVKICLIPTLLEDTVYSYEKTYCIIELDKRKPGGTPSASGKDRVALFLPCARTFQNIVRRFRAPHRGLDLVNMRLPVGYQIQMLLYAQQGDGRHPGQHGAQLIQAWLQLPAVDEFRQKPYAKHFLRAYFLGGQEKPLGLIHAQPG